MDAANPDLPANARSRALQDVIAPRMGDLLGGFKVRRALPARTRRMVGPFIFLDQIGPSSCEAGAGSTSRPTRTLASRR